MPDYSTRLNNRITTLKTPGLVGLDPRWNMLPEEITEPLGAADASLANVAQGFQQFCCEVIDIVAPLVPAVKPQVAFFEQLGPTGITALHSVMQYARERGLIVVADGKRGDIGSTAAGYATAWLAGEDPSSAPFPADALTINPYLGADTLEPFIDLAVERNAGLYVLARTSNPGAAVFQDRITDGRKLFETVAETVQQFNEQHRGNQQYGPVGAVVGATWPEELQQLRALMPNTPLLVPGYGSQGGSAADVAGAFDENGLGAIINSSRGINFAYRSEKYSTQFDKDAWRDAIKAATEDMITDLATHTPAGNLGN